MTMRKLDVWYNGWGQHWPLGTLADDGTNLLFEYGPAALEHGLELSPLRLALRRGAYGDFPSFFNRLPGLVADSLPDGWGLLLMDRVFRGHGIDHPNALDRLAFVGNRAMGALSFLPPGLHTPEDPDWSLTRLARESERALDGDAPEVLAALVALGGSPQGARPKAVVQYNSATGNVSTRGDGPGEPWLVKFPAKGEHAEVCAIESLYADLARACGIEMPATRLFKLPGGLAAFGAARFDRERGLRVPIHSLSGLLHADFRVPGSVDYETFLRATRAMTHDEREVESAFARCAFNVVFHNRDDHSRNFSYRLGANERWRLTPAYDLTFSDGPGGEHSLDVAGKGNGITRGDLIQLATKAGIRADHADETLDRTSTVADSVRNRGSAFPIRRETLTGIAAAVSRCRV